MNAKRNPPRRPRTYPVIPARPVTGRQHACQVLIACETQSRFVHELLQDSFRKSPVPAERGFCAELVYGVIRRRLTLDRLIQHLSHRAFHEVEPGLWLLLRMGVAQLLLMDGTPDHAAISETVELTRWLKHPRWTGMVNAVLRSAQRLLTGDIAEHPAGNHVPLSDGRYRVLNEAPFADPSSHPSQYISQAFSYPEWLIERWMALHGMDHTLKLAAWFNEPPRFYLRVNRLGTDREAVLRWLAEYGLDAVAGTLPESVQLKQSASFEQLELFQHGAVSIQDETAMQAARLLDPKPGWRILDLCAAPGTKATHLAELMNDTGQILAIDSNADRLERVEDTCRRLGLQCIKTRRMDLVQEAPPTDSYDAILLDVPCSNTGVMGKRPEVRWRLSKADFTELVGIQQQLLVRAIGCAQTGTRILYSTCSFDPVENQQVIAWALSQFPQLQLVSEHEFPPGQPADGGYQALLIVGPAAPVEP